MLQTRKREESPSRIGDAVPMKAAERLASSMEAEAPEELRERLSLHLPRLIDRLGMLYGCQDDFQDWLECLHTRLLRWHAERSPALRQLDRERLSDPAWFQGEDMIAYSAYVDRFAGTLKGVEERIPHLERLGIRYLHLLPFLRARSGENDGGFAVESYDEIEPRLGDRSDLERLTAKLRESGISLCSDFVLNHVADTHEWARAARRGEEGYRRYFHILSSRQDADAFERSLSQVFPQTAPGNFTLVPEAGGWVWTTFYPYQWDLNYANREVFLAMTDALMGLANRGVEIFRLDSTAYLWKRPGTNCMNQPEAHLILQALRAIVDIVAPGVLLKAEAIVPARELSPYFGFPDRTGEECHLAYQSSLMSALWVCLAEEDAGLVRKILQEAPALPPRAAWLTYVRCHDDIGWNVLRDELGTDSASRLAKVSQFYAGETEGSYACGRAFQSSGADHVHGTNGMTAALTGWSGAASEGERTAAEHRFLLLYGVVLAAGGIPLIYMGDEFALGNDETPAESWPPGADGRQLHRPVLAPHMLTGISDSSTRAGAFFARFRELVSCRKALPELAAGVPTTVMEGLPGPVLGIQRGDKLRCLFNFSHEAVTLPDFGEGWSLKDVLGGQAVAGPISLPGYGMIWLQSGQEERRS